MADYLRSKEYATWNRDRSRTSPHFGAKNANSHVPAATWLTLLGLILAAIHHLSIPRIGGPGGAATRKESSK
jgi:hypothetical protein